MENYISLLDDIAENFVIHGKREGKTCYELLPESEKQLIRSTYIKKLSVAERDDILSEIVYKLGFNPEFLIVTNKLTAQHVITLRNAFNQYIDDLIEEDLHDAYIHAVTNQPFIINTYKSDMERVA